MDATVQHNKKHESNMMSTIITGDHKQHRIFTSRRQPLGKHHMIESSLDAPFLIVFGQGGKNEQGVGPGPQS